MRGLSIPILTAALAATPLAAAPPAPQPLPVRGTISIEPRTADGDYDPSLSAFASAASRTLTTMGFTVLDQPGHTALALELILGRADVGTALDKVKGQSKPMVSGGLIVPLSTGRSDIVSVQRVRLEIRIRRRGETGIAWHGTAVTVRAAGAGSGSIPVIASDLTHALLETYPRQPPGEIGVP